MSKIKEKKLNSIKSEMEEIKKHITSSETSNIYNNEVTDFSSKNVDDTLTLTKIVKKENKMIDNNDLDKIKNELKELKSSVYDNKELLKQILSKIK